ncbi:MAG: hypothetical protein ACREK6_07995 [Candidatus Rokuibacteriota bacterium]
MDEARGDDHLGPPRYRGNHGHRDVAPTVAHLLRVKLGDVEGTLVDPSSDRSGELPLAPPAARHVV